MILLCFISNANSVVAVSSIIIAVLSLIVSVRALYLQNEHERKSVMPIGWINLANYKNKIEIAIMNNGIGPMIIDDITTLNRVTGEKKGCLIDWFSNCNHGIVFDTYHTNLGKHAIKAGSKIALLRYSVDTSVTNEIEKAQFIRDKLKNLTLEICFHDIYDKSYNIKKDLDWFGR